MSKSDFSLQEYSVYDTQEPIETHYHHRERNFGITAARHIRKRSDHKFTVISAESDHFYSRTALRYIYMGHMRYEHTKPYEDWFWEKNRISLVRDYVEKVESDQKKLLLRSGNVQHYDVLILALGSRYNKFGWRGQDLQGVQGLVNLQDLELMEQNSKGIQKGVIVGGGLIGVEMAEMLQTRNISVTMLIREENYWANVLPAPEARMVNRIIREHDIDLRLATELKEIKGGPDGKVTGVVTNAGEEIECQFVGLTIGVKPNISFLKSSKIKCLRRLRRLRLCMPRRCFKIGERKRRRPVRETNFDRQQQCAAYFRY